MLPALRSDIFVCPSPPPFRLPPVHCGSTDHRCGKAPVKDRKAAKEGGGGTPKKKTLKNQLLTCVCIAIHVLRPPLTLFRISLHLFASVYATTLIQPPPPRTEDSTFTSSLQPHPSYPHLCGCSALSPSHVFQARSFFARGTYRDGATQRRWGQVPRGASPPPPRPLRNSFITSDIFF